MPGFGIELVIAVAERKVERFRALVSAQHFERDFAGTAMARFHLKMMSGIDRPAIAALWPTLRGESIVLDVGASIGADAEHLVDLAAMGGADAVAFTGGIGENSSELRALICEGLDWMGLDLDPEANDATVGGREGRITREGARLAAWVIPTDEELLIARDTVRLVLGMDTRY